MSSFQYTRTRERSRNNSPPPLLHRTSYKRQRLVDEDEDDGHDDYPYSGNHRPSRAVVRRHQPSQLERWNIWSDAHKEERCDSAAEDDELSRQRRRRGVTFTDEVDEDEERAFRLRVARLSCSRSRHVSLPSQRYRVESDDERARAHVWPGELFHRRERCVSEDYEARERARSRSREHRHRESAWFDDHGDDEEDEKDTETERWVRWRRIKRTKTEEWRPLAGWRRV